MRKLLLKFALLLILVAAISYALPQQHQNVIIKKKQPPLRPKPGQVYDNALGKNKKQRPQIQQQQQLENQQPAKQQSVLIKHKLFTKSIQNLGRIRGRVIKSEWTGKKIMQFLDLPYGKSPIGAMRFKASVPAVPWQGVLAAHRYHTGCPSIQDLEKIVALMEHNIDVEDCLRLSISTKDLDDQVPVMVYLHGDFFYDGDTVEAAPGYLLEQDIVLVAVRYRLGPLGFLSTMTEDIPGNAAVHDIVLALKWVQQHITYFGGDPNRVTLFGQVGGSALINVLTLSPAVPDGLFHRVIYQSGSALAPAFITDSPLAATRDIARIAGCKSVNKLDVLNKCIKRLNTTALLYAFSVHGESKSSLGVGAYGGVQLVIGGPSGILPEHPGKLLNKQKFKAYPTMGGSVKHGGTFLLKDIFIDSFNETVLDDQLTGMEYIEHIIEQTNGADSTDAWKKYAEQQIFSAVDIKNGSFQRLTPGLIDLCSTIQFKNPVLLVLQANARKLPNSTYLYSFNYEGEVNRYETGDNDIYDAPFDMGVSLTDDNLYLFPWPRYNMINSIRDTKIAKRMVELWTSFAGTGVPKAANVPAWPAMHDETGPYIKIDRIVSFGDNYLDEFAITVKETELGYSLVNDEYFDDIKAEMAGQNGSTDNENIDEDDEDDAAVDEGRGNKLVFIAQKVRIN